MLVYITIGILVFGILHLIRFSTLVKTINKINTRISEKNTYITLTSVWNKTTYIPYASLEKSSKKLKWYNPLNYNFREIITHE